MKVNQKSVDALNSTQHQAKTKEQVCNTMSSEYQRREDQPHTVDSRYLELGYLEFCETRSVDLNQKYILIAFSNHNLALEAFLLVQITRSAN